MGNSVGIIVGEDDRGGGEKPKRVGVIVGEGLIVEIGV
jgi:hypothetical protein